MQNVEILNFNCRRKPSINGVLEEELRKGLFDILLLQEPAANHHKVYFNSIGSRVIYDKTNLMPRTCIIVGKRLRNSVFIVSEFTDNDRIVIRLKLKDANGNWMNYLICNIYLHDSLSPDQIKAKLKPINEYADKHNLRLIICGDMNCHHPLWSNKSEPLAGRIRNRGEGLFEHICTHGMAIKNNLDWTRRRILEDGRIEESIIDLVLTSHSATETVMNFRTLKNTYYGSDHIPIVFNIGKSKNEVHRVRNIRKLNVPKYRNIVSSLFPVSFNINNVDELNQSASKIIDIFKAALEKSCPLIFTSKSIEKPWYTTELDNQRKKVWRAYADIDEALKNGESSQKLDDLFGIYNLLKKEYEDSMMRERLLSFQEFATEIEGTDELARLTNINKRIDEHENITMRMNNNQFTTCAADTLDLLVDKCFPQLADNIDVNLHSYEATVDEKKLIDEKVTAELIAELIYEFDSYKSPGLDDVYPIMMKSVSDIIAPGMADIIKFCLYTGLTPSDWLESKVIFIPKPGKSDYTDPKSFRPICLTTFLLKLIEKVVARLMLDKISKLHAMQFAYRESKSAVEALTGFSHQIMKRIVRKTTNGKIRARKTTYASFADISSAFDNPLAHKIEASLRKYEFEEFLIRWIMNMNSNRIITATFCDERRTFKPTCGFAQGGNLSCYLWIIYVNELVVNLNNIEGIVVYVFSDDLAIVSLGKGDTDSQEKLQIALDMLQEWCDNNELSVNPSKCVHMRFSRKRTFPPCNIKFYGQPIEFSDEVRYLGVVFDRRMNFRKHLDYVRNKITRYTWRLRLFIGRNWGLDARKVKWAYNAIILPKISYASSVFIHSLSDKVNLKIIQKAQNNAVRIMACTIKTTPKLSMRAAFGIIAIENELKISATMELIRLYNLNQWEPSDQDVIRDWQERELGIVELATRCDWVKLNNTDRIHIVQTSEQDWRDGKVVVEGVAAYTDASVDRARNRTGIGIYSLGLNIEMSLYADTIMTSYKAELLAINRLLTEILNKRVTGMNISIITDSMSALTALQNKRCRSVILMSIKKQLKILQDRNVTIKLMWIPAHTSNSNEHFDGNNEADRLTRDPLATHCNLIAMAPQTRKEIKKTLRTKYIACEVWPQTTHIVSRAFRMDEMLRDGKDLVKYSRKDLTLLLRFMSGFSCLAQHMKYVLDLDHETETYCRFCEDRTIKETSIHIIEDCSRFTAARMKIFSQPLLKLRDEKLDTDDILEFIHETPTLAIRLLQWTPTEEDAFEIFYDNERNATLSFTVRRAIRDRAAQQSMQPRANINDDVQ